MNIDRENKMLTVSCYHLTNKTLDLLENQLSDLTLGLAIHEGPNFERDGGCSFVIHLPKSFDNSFDEKQRLREKGVPYDLLSLICLCHAVDCKALNVTNEMWSSPYLVVYPENDDNGEVTEYSLLHDSNVPVRLAMLIMGAFDGTTTSVETLVHAGRTEIMRRTGFNDADMNAVNNCLKATGVEIPDECSFIDSCLRKEAKPEDINDYVERWHTQHPNGAPIHTLSEFLGMTPDEYEMWVKCGDSAIPSILENREKNADKPTEVD